MTSPRKSAPARRASGKTAAQRLQAEKRALVRAAIRHAALDLFLERGFETVRVEEIAERAGVSRRTFFRYFASRDDLMAQGVDEFRDVVRRVLEGSPRGSTPVELFRTTVGEVARISASAPRSKDVVKIMLASPAARKAQMSRVAPVEDLLEEAFRDRCRGKERKAAGILAAMTLAAVGAIMREWCLAGNVSVERITDEVLEAWDRSLRAKAPK